MNTKNVLITIYKFYITYLDFILQLHYLDRSRRREVTVRWKYFSATSTRENQNKSKNSYTTLNIFSSV